MGKTAAFFAALALSALLFVSSAHAAPEPARSADSFVDSVGVNIHLHYMDTTYAHFEDIVKPRLVALGVRHVRDGATDTTFHTYYDRLNALGKLGIKGLFVINPRDITAIGDQDRAFIKDFARRVPDSIEAYEGPNEYDFENNHKSDPHWVQTLQEFQSVLYRTVKDTPALKGIAVVGPSMGAPHDYGHPPVPDLGASVDYGNAHPYPFGGNPFSDRAGYDTIDWYFGHGDFPADNLDEFPAAFDNARPMAVGKPLMFTETGYFTGTAQGSTSETAFAKYVPRLVCETFRKNVARTYFYEFLDERVNLADKESNFGLVGADGTPKVAYTALKSLLALLAERGVSPDFRPKSLDYTLTVSPVGAYTRTQYVHHLLLQKSDGPFYLLLWHEVSDEDVSVNPHRQIAPSALPAMLTLPATIRHARLFRLDGNAMGTSLPLRGGTISLNVPDQVIVLKLAP